MAEIGAIASGMGIASLGLQLMDGIRKLKQFFDEVKDASEDMHYALEELEILGLTLSDIHTDNPSLPPIPAVTATKCLELCRRGTDMLSTIVKDLNGAISKRRMIGSTKVVLKKDTLEKFRNRLRDAQYMLILSRQTYSEALQLEYHKLQIEAVQSSACRQQQEFEELKASITHSIGILNPLGVTNRIAYSPAIAYDDQLGGDYCGDDDEIDRHIENRTRFPSLKQTKRFQSKLKMPRWFSYTNFTWDFSGFQGPSGWTFSFRHYYTVGRKSPTWECVEKGDVSGMQVLFQSKKATPFDRTPWGTTLLDRASANGDYEMCCLLLDQGADPNESFPEYVYTLANFSQSFLTMPWARSSLLYATRKHSTAWGQCPCYNNVLRLLCPLSEIDNPIKDFAYANITEEELTWLLDNTDPNWKRQSAADRIKFALRWCSAMRFRGAESAVGILPIMLQQKQLNEACYKLILEGSPIPPHDFLSLEIECMTQAVHARLKQSGEAFIHSRSTFRRFGKSTSELNGRLSRSGYFKSIEMIQQLIIVGFDVYCGHLLYNMLFSFYEDYSFQFDIRDFYKPVIPVAVQVWLEILDDLRVDLLAYGKKEHGIFVKKTTLLGVYLKPQMSHDENRIEERHSAHLISFSYGPKIDDWKFWFALEKPCWDYYQNFRLFWELVEHPEKGVPGAWYEDTSDNESDQAFEQWPNFFNDFI